MQGLGPIGRGIAIATLLCFAAPQAEAIEAYGTGPAAMGLDDGLIVQVRGGRGGGVHRGGGARHGGDMHRGGGMHHGMNRGGVNRCCASRKLPRRESLRQSQHQPERESQRQPKHESERLPQRESRGLLGQLGAAGRILVAGRRRGRGRRGARLRQRGGCGLVGGRGARSEPLLVLHRPEPPAGLLGRLPLG